MADSDALRREVSRLRSLVTKKVYRVKKTSGAHVGGTHFDPRPRIPVTRMTDKQLSAYQSKFSDFLKRDAAHQFVPGYSGSVLTRATFHAYKAAEQKANATKGGILRQYDNIVMPGQYNQTTVANFTAQRRASFPHMTDDATYRPSEMHRDSKKIDGESAARKLTEQQNAQATQEWYTKKIAQGRENYATMVDMMGRPDLKDKVNELSDEQFGLLLFGSPFMEQTSLKYLASQKEFRRKGVDDAIDQAFTEHDMWIEWAGSQQF